MVMVVVMLNLGILTLNAIMLNLVQLGLADLRVVHWLCRSRIGLGAARLHREGNGPRGRVRLRMMKRDVGGIVRRLVLHLWWCSGLDCAGVCCRWWLWLGVGAYMGVGVDGFALRWRRHFDVVLRIETASCSA